jgi:hypothetical protein
MTIAAKEPQTIGIDVSKTHLDVAVQLTNEGWQEDNDNQGINSLVEKLTRLDRP